MIFLVFASTFEGTLNVIKVRDCFEEKGWISLFNFLKKFVRACERSIMCDKGVEKFGVYDALIEQSH